MKGTHFDVVSLIKRSIGMVSDEKARKLCEKWKRGNRKIKCYIIRFNMNIFISLKAS